MKILPAKKIVVLEPIKLTEIGVDKGIAVAEEKAPEIGKVIAIGEAGKKGLPVKMKVGDIIAYRRYGESKFWIGSKRRLFVSFDDVLGVIKK